MFEPNFQLSIKIEGFNNPLVNSFKLPLFLDKSKYFTKNDIWLDYLVKGDRQISSLNNNTWEGQRQARKPLTFPGGNNTLPIQLKITIDSQRQSRRFSGELRQGTDDSISNRFAANSSFNRTGISCENLEWQEDTAFKQIIDSITVVEKKRSRWDKLYIFGDSLSDTGNVLNITEGQFPISPYAKGRFSNGDIWVDYLSEKLDLDIEPFTNSLSGNFIPSVRGRDSSLNFAIGGATSGEENVGIVPFGLEQQVDNFKIQNQSSQELLDDDLFSVWIGANDYFSFIEDDPTTEEIIEANFPNRDEEIVDAVIEVVDINIGNAVREIIDAGGENIAIFNLPNIDQTPLARNLVEEDRRVLQKLTMLHNQYLLNLVEKTETFYPDANVLKIDVNSLFNEILESPRDFGFTNVADNYSGIDVYTGNNSSSSEGNEREYLFFDSVHPTTTAQGLIADLVATQLDKFIV